MHESRLVADLVAKANAVVADGVTSVDSVRLEVLAGSHIDPATLADQFGIWAQGTAVAGARVLVERSDREGPGDVMLVSVSVRD